MSVDATRRRVNRTASTASDSVMVVTEELPRDSWTCSGSDLPQRAESAVSVDCAVSLVGGPASAFLSGADGCVDFAGEGAVVVTSPAVLTGDVAVGVTLLAVAGAASPADLTEVVAVDVTPSALLGWRPRPTLLGLSPQVWYPWPMLGRRPWPMLGWRSRLTLLGLTP